MLLIKSFIDKGKPFERMGRKTTGLIKMAGLPEKRFGNPAFYFNKEIRK